MNTGNEVSEKPAFGSTRYGKYNSPNPLVIGRHDSVERLKGNNAPGFSFYEAGKSGKDKPHAIILSRPTAKTKALDPEFQNVFGLTRFGKAGTPSAVLRGRPKVKELLQPGPGAYELDGCDECRIGISLKGRWQQVEGTDGSDTPGPKYTLPTIMGKGPAYSLSPKYIDKSNKNCSPGPIYLLYPEGTPGAGLTFKPFPLSSHENDAGPASFNTMEAALKTLHSAPSTRFAKAFCNHCDWTPRKEKSNGPGPATVNIRECPSTGPSPPTALLVPRRSSKLETQGVGFVDLFGMSRFGRKGKKSAMVVSRHERRDKSSGTHTRRYIPGTYEGDADFKSKKLGIKIKSRLKGLELNCAENPGPGTYNIGGFIGRGPAFSLGPKHRGPMRQSDQLHASYLRDPSECQPKDTAEPYCDPKELKEPQRNPVIPPASDHIYDIIPYLEQLCTNY